MNKYFILLCFISLFKIIICDVPLSPPSCKPLGHTCNKNHKNCCDGNVCSLLDGKYFCTLKTPLCNNVNCFDTCCSETDECLFGLSPIGVSCVKDCECTTVFCNNGICNTPPPLCSSDNCQDNCCDGDTCVFNSIIQSDECSKDCECESGVCKDGLCDILCPLDCRNENNECVYGLTGFDGSCTRDCECDHTLGFYCQSFVNTCGN
jgi:hypothetical protein